MKKYFKNSPGVDVIIESKNSYNLEDVWNSFSSRPINKKNKKNPNIYMLGNINPDIDKFLGR